MKRTLVTILGLTGIALAAAAWLPKPGPGVLGGGGGGTPLAVPDFDGDGKGEQLSLVAVGADRTRVVLTTTKGDTKHAVLQIAGAGPWTPVAEGRGWVVRDAAGATKVTVKAVPSGKGTDMLVVGSRIAKRYHWIDRGYLKLDAREITPGFSAGLVLLDDEAATLAAMSGPVAADGKWAVPVPGHAPMTVTLEKDRVKAVTFTDPALHTRTGVGVGAQASSLTDTLPGRLAKGQWISGRYGMTGTLEDEQVVAFTVSKPWIDPLAPKEEPPKVGAEARRKAS